MQLKATCDDSNGILTTLIQFLLIICVLSGIYIFMTPNRLVVVVDRCRGKYLELAEETTGGCRTLHSDELGGCQMLG
jgi:hypothetical protein